MASKNLLYLTFWGLEGSWYCSSKPGIFMQYHVNTIYLRIEICHTSGWIQQCGVAAWITPSMHSIPTDKKITSMQNLTVTEPEAELCEDPLFCLVNQRAHTCGWRDSAVSGTIVPQWSLVTLQLYWGCSPWLQLLRGSGGFITRRKPQDRSMQDCYSLTSDLPFRSFTLFWLLFFADQKRCNYQIKL